MVNGYVGANVKRSRHEEKYGGAGVGMVMDSENGNNRLKEENNEGYEMNIYSLNKQYIGRAGRPNGVKDTDSKKHDREGRRPRLGKFGEAAGRQEDEDRRAQDQLVMMEIFMDERPNYVPEWLARGGEGIQVDLNVIIDEYGHTSVHWAAALARIEVLDLLLANGADAKRLDYDGESALIKAVQVTNNYETQVFHELLELLHDAIPLTDKSNKTVLHHIANTAGIAGRGNAARYYMECLLAWITRLAGGFVVDNSSADTYSASKSYKHALFATPASQRRKLTGRPSADTEYSPANRDAPSADLAAFLDLQDANGDTALNIASRVGDRAIVQLLMSVGASSTIPNNSGLRPSDFWGADTPYDSSTTLPLSSAKKTPIVNSNVTTTSVRSTGSNRQLYKSHQPYDFSSLTTPNSIRYSNTRGSSDPRNYYHRKSAEPPNPSFTYPTTTPAAIHSSAHSSNTSSATSTKSIPLSSKPLTDPKENRRLFYPPNHSHLRTSSSSSQSLSTLNSIRALVSDLDLEFRSELNSKNDQIKALKDQLDSLNAQLADQRDVFRKHADSLVLVDQMKQQVASLEFQLDQIKSFDPSLSSPHSHSHEFVSCLNSLLNTNSNNVHDLLEMLTVPNILASKNSPSAGDYHRIIENLSNLVSLVVKDNVQMKDSLSLLQLNRQNLNQALKICLDEKYNEDGAGNAQLDDSQANGVGSPKNISTSRNGQSNSGNANANAFASKSSERWLEKLDQLVSSFVSSNTSDANVGTNPATINNAIEQDNTSNDNDDIGTNSASRKKLKSALVNLVNIIDS